MYVSGESLGFYPKKSSIQDKYLQPKQTSTQNFPCFTSNLSETGEKRHDRYKDENWIIPNYDYWVYISTSFLLYPP